MYHLGFISIVMVRFNLDVHLLRMSLKSREALLGAFEFSVVPLPIAGELGSLGDSGR